MGEGENVLKNEFDNHLLCTKKMVLLVSPSYLIEDFTFC